MYEKLECKKCGVPLEMKRVEFGYLKQNFFTEIPACTKCGQIYVPEELATGKMADVEKNLEEK